MFKIVYQWGGAFKAIPGLFLQRVGDKLTFMKKRTQRKTEAASYRILLTPAEEGGFTVTVPTLPGCVSEGDTYPEAVRNIKDAIRGYIESAREHGDPIPPGDCIEDIVRIAI